MRSPQQFKACHRRTFSEFFPITDQAFSDREVFRLVDECESVALESFLNGSQMQSGEIEAKSLEQFKGCDPVFDRHPVSALQHHGLKSSQEHKHREWVNRCGACPSVEGHPEADRGNGVLR